MASDEKLEEMLVEISDLEWDAILLNETWRDQPVEDFNIQGHRWFGSGGAAKKNETGWKHGVGILLHRRWASAVTGTTAVNPRVIYVDLQVGAVRVRLICGYMPHGGLTMLR